MEELPASCQVSAPSRERCEHPASTHSSQLFVTRLMRAGGSGEGSEVLTPRYARPRGRSHNTSSALTCSPHLEGSASSRSPPRRDQRGRRATHASDPPTHTSHRQGTNAARLQSRQSQSSKHSESQQPLRLRAGGWATKGRQLSTHLRTRGAPTTRRAGADRARPSAGPPPLRRAAPATGPTRIDRWS